MKDIDFGERWNIMRANLAIGLIGFVWILKAMSAEPMPTLASETTGEPISSGNRQTISPAPAVRSFAGERPERIEDSER